MIQVAIALLAGFVIGWLILLHREVVFSAGAAVVLLALLEALSYGWLTWSKQVVDATPKSLTKPVILHFLAGCIFGLIILEFGVSIGEDLRLVATIPIATVFLLNLYKVVSENGK